MQAFLSGLALACVSAITVLAFRHPKGFAKLFPFFVSIITGILTLAIVWQVGVEITWSVLTQFIANDQLDQARAAKHELTLPFGWIAVCYVAIVAFLWVNLKLPPFLQMLEQRGADGRGKSQR